MKQGSFISQGLTLAYMEWGEPEAPLVILVHGSRDTARSWDWTAEALVANGWRVVAYDLRGHGDSDWSPDGAYLTSYQVQDLADLADHLEAARFVLAGHSFGGTVCARYAAMFPERVERLCLIDGMGPGPEIFAKWAALGPVERSRQWLAQRRAAARKPARLFASVEDAAAQLAAGIPGLDPEFYTHLAAHAVKPGGSGWVWKSDPQMSHFPPEDYFAETDDVWTSILCPTLVFWAGRSFTVDPVADGRCALIGDCRTVVYDAAGHWLHHEKFDSFITELRRFVGLPAAAASREARQA